MELHRLSALRLSTAGSYRWFQKAADCIGHALHLGSRMRSEAAAMQTLLDGRRDEVLGRECHTVRRGSVLGVRTTRDSATGPKKSLEVYPDCCRRFGMERIGYVDPNAHPSYAHNLDSETLVC